METDGNEGALLSGSLAAALRTRCQRVMTAQQGGTQQNRRQNYLHITSSTTTTSHIHALKGRMKVQRGLLALIQASRNVKVEIQVRKQATDSYNATLFLLSEAG